MKNILLGIIAILIAASFLQADESLVVEFTSSGCFHYSTDIIVITSDTVTISTIDSERSDEKSSRVEMERELLGTVKLAKEDINRLDALFEFYANGPDDRCTTVDHVKISLQKNNKMIKGYEFSDSSCKTYDMKTILTFGELKAKLRK